MIVPVIVKKHILVVDDSATVRNVIAKHLGNTYIVSHASNGDEAWQLIQSDASITLVFSDMHMPVMNGMMLLKLVRSSESENISNLPVIMITGHQDTDVAKQISYTMGATDFISKPFSPIDIISRAGSYTKLAQEIATLEKNASHDSLTKLFNKQGLKEIGDKAISSSHRHQHELSVLIMQIKNSDEIASRFSKKTIQQIIISIAENIKKMLRDEDVLAHYGSGKFAILLPLTREFKARIIALRIQQKIDNLVFKVKKDTVKIKLVAGLNSTNACNHDVSFTELCLSAEKDSDALLQHNTSNIIRHGELLHKKQRTEKHIKPSSSHKGRADVRRSRLAGPEDAYVASQSNYMLEILNGNFEKIPAQDVENLINPMESFLKYAYARIQKQKK